MLPSVVTSMQSESPGAWTVSAYWPSSDIFTTVGVPPPLAGRFSNTMYSPSRARRGKAEMVLLAGSAQYQTIRPWRSMM